MALYARRQLLLLVIVLGAAGVGLGVGHWRRANPDVVDALEHLDRAPPPAPRASMPRLGARPRSETVPLPGPPCEPRRSRRGGTPGEAPPAPPEIDSPAIAPPVETVSLTTAW